MKKLLPLLKKLLPTNRRSWSIALMLVVLIAIGNKSQAQVYYLTNDATSGSTSGVDGINRMDYNGNNAVLLANSFTNSPGLMELDLPNNRAFVYEAFSTSPPTGLSIKVVNLSTGAVTATIPITESTARCYSIKYDAINDYIYYLVADSGPTGATANDALIKVKPDGSGKTVVISGFSSNPNLLTLNVANNKAYVYNQLAADKKLRTINLTTGTVEQTITITVPAGNPFLMNGMDYDPATDYIYLLGSNNAGTTNDNDGIFKVHPDGTDFTKIVSVPQSPTSFALDVNNNRAFVFDNVAPARNITSYDLTTGTGTLIKSLSSLPGSSTVTAMWAPKVATLTTTAASSVVAVSASVGGNITRSDVTVTERGIVYSSSNTVPTIGGSGVTKAANGSGTGSFSGSISGLSPSTTYYYRSYATSAAGTAYGTVNTFTTISNDANLSAFSISAGTLTPSFSSGTTSYTASVTGSTSTITVTPTKNQANASIKVNNVTVASGSASSPIALNIGDNIITTVVTAQDGTTKTYTLTVSRVELAQTITFNTLPAKSYGDADFAPGATASSGLTVSYSSDNTAVATIVSGQIHIVGVGTANITASQAGDGNYNAATSVIQTLTVSKATVNVTANAQTKVYGNSDPVLTYTATGVINGDTPTGTLERTTGVNVGTYAINQGTLSYGTNYNLVYTVANLTINKRPITVLPVGKTKVYGSNDPFLNSFQITSGSLAPGDATGDQFGRATGENVGTYLMTLGTKKFYTGGVVDGTANYDITVQPAYFTITAKPVTVTANAQSKTYGDADPELTYTSTELAYSDTFTGTLSRNAGEAVGTYAITQGTLALSGNYELTYVGNSLTINKANLTYVANPATRFYQTANPTFTGSVTGFVNGDTQETATSGTLSFTTTATTSSPVGSYPINGDGLTAANYNFVQAAANSTALTITTSNDATLSAITINAGSLTPAFSSGQESYSANVAYAVSTLNISATVNQQNASITINGQPYTSGSSKSIALNTGTNNINIVVIAQNGATKIYSLVVTRAMPATDANYSAITLTPVSTLIPTSPGNFKTSVAASQTSVKVTTIPQQANATVTVNGTSVANGVASGSIALNQPATTITVVITAEDGVTSKRYTVVVNRQGSSNVLLSSIGLIPASTLTTVSPDNYSTSVSSDQTSVSVKAVTQDAGATLTVNGVPATSGVASSPVALVGESTLIPIVVTAADGSTVKTYTITVTRSGSSSTTVNNIALSPASQLVLTSANHYITSVAAGQANVSVITSVQDANTTIKVNGITTASGVASAPVTLTGPSTDITVLITAQSGLTKTYTITVNRAGSNNAILTNINLTPSSVLTLTSGNSNFRTSVNAGQSSVTVTPTAQNETATIEVNGSAVASGSASAPIALSMGATVINIVVTAGDGVTTKNYTVTVNRAGSSDARISNIALIPSAPLTQTSLGNYTASVIHEQTSITVTATAVDAGTTIKINGVTTASGTASAPIALAVGSNVINVVATAEDGTTTKSYTVTVSRAASGESRLSNINLTPSSILTETGINTYNTSVGISQNSVTVSAVPVDPASTIKINGVAVNNGVASGAIILNPGSTAITIVVTAANGITTKTYTVNVNRSGSSDARISSIALTPSSVLTQLSPNNYTTNVSGTQNTVRVTVNAVNVNSIITVQGIPVTSGVASDEITLAGGATDVLIQVVAEDGSTTKNYKVTVNKPLARNSFAVTKSGANMIANKAGKTFEKDEIIVHKGLSPNGDGFNDFLVIEGLSSYTNTKLSVMNTSGTLVFDMKDYGKDGSRVFEGRAKNGTLLKAGTYYYTLDYKDGDKDKRKTGYIIIKF
ncbi:cadherin-like beta sandwich domain-containing protein [Mucilaginibacter lutimaris]|uniref:Cadherin-like beta sandwich domain-containing protein n=1 Tax=Mucilaginibacter lutimaris TaxID=931629 RepID=A0ABW2ZCI8_9SPHI